MELIERRPVESEKSISHDVKDQPRQCGAVKIEGQGKKDEEGVYIERSCIGRRIERHGATRANRALEFVVTVLDTH